MKIDEYRESFISKIGDPTSVEALDRYLLFVIDSSLDTENIEGYIEKHHILPRSMFETSDVFTLEYENHIEAHCLLAEAYPIRSFLMPLRFMFYGRGSLEYQEQWSLAVKNWWKLFKKSEKYDGWRKKRSIACSKHMLAGHAKHMNNLANTPEINQKRREHSLMMRSDKEKERIRIVKLKKTINSVEGKRRAKAACQKRWDSMTNEDRDSFKRMMFVINGSEEKRADASIKLKEKWKDPEYRVKMGNRRRGSNSNTMKEKWKDPEFRSFMLEKRKQKKNETNKHKEN